MSKLKSYALAAVLAAVYAVIAQITIPFPLVPLSFQCFAIALGGYAFGCRIGLISTALYIGIGAVGLPVFSGFRGGAEVLFGPTGGFIWGFILLALFCGFGKNKKRSAAFVLGMVGLIFCNALGVLQFSLLGKSGITAFILTSAPYILKDAFLLWVAISLAPTVSASVLRKR